MEITILQSWDLWLQGIDIQNRLLWGLEIFWWGRAGLLVLFIAFLTVLAAVVGDERLSAVGAEVRTKAGLKNTLTFALRPLLALLQILGLKRAQERYDEDIDVELADEFEIEDSEGRRRSSGVDNDDVLYLILAAIVAIGIVGYVLATSGDFFPSLPRRMMTSEIIDFGIKGGIAIAQFLGLVLLLLFTMAATATGILLVLTLPGLIVSYGRTTDRKSVV